MIYAGLQAAADEIMAKTNGEVKVSIMCPQVISA